MQGTSDKELYCPVCGLLADYPICCTQSMELDGQTFFCNICGKERPLPMHCGVYMQVREVQEEDPFI